MQLLKISLILGLVTSLCSFAYYSAYEDGQERLYKEFLSKFEQVDLPSSLTLEAHVFTNEMTPKTRQQQLEKAQSKKEQEKILTKEYSSFIPGISRGMMSRMGPSTYKAEYALASVGKYSAIIYSESRSFDAGAKSYMLATFDGKGKSIDTRYIGFADFDTQTEVVVNEKLELTIKELFMEDDSESYLEKSISKMFITPKGEILVHEKVSPSNEEVPMQKQAPVKFS